jgi:hypothetical protein
MLWFLIGVALLLIWIVTLVDVLSRKDMTGGKKAAWTLLVILLPIIGVPAYFIVKPPDTPHPFMSGGAGSDEEQLRARHPF